MRGVKDEGQELISEAFINDLKKNQHQENVTQIIHWTYVQEIMRLNKKAITDKEQKVEEEAV